MYPQPITVIRSRRLLRVLAGLAIGAVLAVIDPYGQADAYPAVVAVPGTARVAAVVPGAPGLPRMLGGFTAQNWPVAMQVPAAGKRIVVAGVGLSMQCRSGAAFGTRDFMADVRIRARGVVHESRRLFPQRFADGGVLTPSDSLNGQFNRDRTAFTGTWHLHFDYTGPNNQTDSCDSGQVHLAATL